MPISDVAKGIFAKYTGSALSSVLAGGLHEGKAPQSVTKPYCVCENISCLNDDTFGKDMEYHRWQFTIWTDDLNKRTANTGLDALVSTLKTLFDDTILTVTDWTNTGMRFVAERSAYSEDMTVVGAIIEYETYISK